MLRESRAFSNVLGYRWRLEPEPTEAQAVRLIFAMAEQNESYQGIANMLNAMHYRTVEGSKFQRAHVQRVLRRESFYRAQVAYDRKSAAVHAPILTDAGLMPAEQINLVFQFHGDTWEQIARAGFAEHGRGFVHIDCRSISDPSGQYVAASSGSRGASPGALNGYDPKRSMVLVGSIGNHRAEMILSLDPRKTENAEIEERVSA